jgi:PKD repeat protein
MENLWGNIWQFQDGFNAIQGTTNIVNKTGFNLTNGRTTFQDLMFSTDVTNVGTLLISDGYQSNLINTDVARGLFLPSSVTGGGETKYLADYYYYPRSTNANAPNILLSGGSWGDAGNVGVGFLLAHTDASYSFAALGARLEFRPPTIPHAITANFTVSNTSGIQPLLVTFTDTSTTTDATIDAWNWSFDDGGISVLQNPDHTFINAGTYNINLTITNTSHSLVSTKIQTVIVYSLPTIEDHDPVVVTNPYYVVYMWKRTA